MAALCGIASAIGIPLLKETYGPLVRCRHYGDDADPEFSALHAEFGTRIRFIWGAMSRPFVILFTSIICFTLSLYFACILGESPVPTLGHSFA